MAKCLLIGDKQETKLGQSKKWKLTQEELRNKEEVINCMKRRKRKISRKRSTKEKKSHNGWT